MEFIRTIGRSIYSPSFYTEVINSRFRSAFGYFFLLALLLTVIGTLVPSYTLITSAPREINKFIANAQNSYPQNLEVKVRNGIVSTNVKEPYFISIPDGDNSDSKAMIVIDTKTPYSSTQFNDYNALVWVAKDTVFAKSSNSEIKTLDLSKVDDFTINKKILANFITEYSPLIKFVAPILIVLMFVGLFIFFTFRLVYLFILALFIMLLTRIMKKNLSYMTAYKIGLYAMTLPFILDLVQTFVHLPRLPLLFTLVTLVVVFVNLKNSPSVKLSTQKK